MGVCRRSRFGGLWGLACLRAAFRQIDLWVGMCGLRLPWCQSDSEHGGQRAAEDVVILGEAESCCRDVLPRCASAMSCCRDVLLLTASKHRAVVRALTPHELVGVGSERCVMDFVPAVEIGRASCRERV